MYLVGATTNYKPLLENDLGTTCWDALFIETHGQMIQCPHMPCGMA